MTTHRAAAGRAAMILLLLTLGFRAVEFATVGSWAPTVPAVLALTLAAPAAVLDGLPARLARISLGTLAILFGALRCIATGLFIALPGPAADAAAALTTSGSILVSVAMLVCGVLILRWPPPAVPAR